MGRPPDFVGIGAQKAGTTWLHDNLEIQGQLWTPPHKELHFFDRVCPNEELAGLETQNVPPLLKRYIPVARNPSLETVRWIRRFFNGALSTGWYHDLFPRSLVRGRIAGEITPAYSTLDRRGVSFAREVLGADCRVFLIVRNPIERSWSAFKMMHRWRGASPTDQDIAGVLSKLQEPSYRLRGDYPRIVDLWRAAFGSSFRVFLYDDLVADARSFLRDVCSFLGASGPFDYSRAAARSNPDPHRNAIPDGLAGRLRAHYESDIVRLDRRIPGVAELWLGNSDT